MSAYLEQQQLRERLKYLAKKVTELHLTNQPLTRRDVADIDREIADVIEIAGRLEDKAYLAGKMEQRIL